MKIVSVEFFGFYKMPTYHLGQNNVTEIRQVSAYPVYCVTITFKDKSIKQICNMPFVLTFKETQ